MDGCRCPACFGLAEYMLGLTGKDYGLPKATGHPPLESPDDREALLERQREIAFRYGLASRRKALPWEEDA